MTIGSCSFAEPPGIGLNVFKCNFNILILISLEYGPKFFKIVEVDSALQRGVQVDRHFQQTATDSWRRAEIAVFTQISPRFRPDFTHFLTDTTIRYPGGYPFEHPGLSVIRVRYYPGHL